MSAPAVPAPAVPVSVIPPVRPLRVLIAGEFSGVVRDAFIALGHDAWSCDLLPTERPGPHYEGDVRDVLGPGWDLLIGHPPCTFLSNSGVKHLYAGGRLENGRNEQRWRDMEAAADFFKLLLNCDIPRICVENPVMHSHGKKLIGMSQSQSIQPWQHGHPECKRTCFWLKGLPLLQPTSIVEGRAQRVHMEPPGPDRWKNRSRTLPGIAKAIAEQWSAYITAEITAEINQDETERTQTR